jgi:hypothetical protein
MWSGLLEVVPSWHTSIVFLKFVEMTVFEQCLGAAAGEQQDP